MCIGGKLIQEFRYHHIQYIQTDLGYWKSTYDDSYLRTNKRHFLFVLKEWLADQEKHQLFRETVVESYRWYLQRYCKTTQHYYRISTVGICRVSKRTYDKHKLEKGTQDKRHSLYTKNILRAEHRHVTSVE